MAWFTYISKLQSDITFSQEFYFNETSHMWSLAKRKLSQKGFQNLHYANLYVLLDTGWNMFL